MSETARVLPFPRRWQVPLSPGEVGETARAFLEKGVGERSQEETDRPLCDPDVVSSICKLLAEAVNSEPKLVSQRASALYCWLNSREGDYGLFDEREYFLGDAARLAAAAFRHLGDREETEIWLERAEASFRHTVNPGPPLTQVAHIRLALAYDKRRFKEVLEIIPSLLKSFEKFGMRSEAAKTRFLEAMALKSCSRYREAFDKFTSLSETLNATEEPGLLGQVLTEIGSSHAVEGRYEEAICSYKKSMTLLATAGRRQAVASLRIEVGETLAAQGGLSAAAEAFREGIHLYDELGMMTYVAYSRVILAETLIALGRHREAEWEILAALPTIEEQKMVPEGFMAVALLRESVGARKANPNALRELRAHLKANG